MLFSKNVYPSCYTLCNLKCIPLSSQPYMIRPIDLNPNELHNYPFLFNLEGYDQSCNDLSDLHDRICVLSKTREIDLKVFIMITLENVSESYLTINVNIIVNNVICSANGIAKYIIASVKNQ